MLPPALLRAQSTSQAPKPIDSASLSKIISRQVKDTAKNAQIKVSDTSVAVIITRVESYTLMLNQVMSSLKRGMDTTRISRNLPLIDAALHVIRQDIAALGATPNVHDLYTNKVMLVQLERRLGNWQEDLFRYYDKLVNISDTLQQLRKDTAIRNIPAEDELRSIYVGQMATLIQKWRQVDSANRKNLLKLGLLQNKVAKRYLDVSNLLEDMDFQLETFSNRMFDKDFSYLWEPPLPGKLGPSFTTVLKRSLYKNLRVLDIFFTIRQPLFLVWLLAALGFLAWTFNSIRRIRRKHGSTESEAILQHSRYLYRHPISATLLIVFTLSAMLSIQCPILYTELIWGVSVLAATVILRHLLPPNILKWWLLLVLLLFIYSVNNLLIQATFAEQWGLFAGAILSIIMGASLLKRLRNTTLPLPRYSRPLIWLFICLSALSLLLVIIARVTAAKIIGASSVVGIVMAVNIALLIEILMEAIYLQVEANKSSSTFISFIDYQNIKTRLKTFFYVLGTIGWLALMTRNLYVYDAIYEYIADFLAAERKVGNITFTYSSAIIFLLVIWVATVLSQVIAYLFGDTGQQAQNKKSRLGSAMLLIRLAILGAGVLLAFAASGIPMDKLAIVIGALGVGIGFGLQNIVNNLVSGVILAFEKPIEVGDVIELGTRSGVVKEIGIRSSKISAYDGSEVIVPNGDLIAQQLINWTLSDRTRRVELVIGVAYGSDIKQVMDILKQSLQNREGLLEVPEPLVFLYRFGDNSIDFRIFFWISDLGLAGPLQSEVLAYIYTHLQEAGIDIPYPQREVHLRVSDDILQQLRGKEQGGGKEEAGENRPPEGGRGDG